MLTFVLPLFLVASALAIPELPAEPAAADVIVPDLTGLASGQGWKIENRSAQMVEKTAKRPCSSMAAKATGWPGFQD